MAGHPDAAEIFGRAIAEHLAVVHELESRQPLLQSIACALSSALKSGAKILWCGNGGSAADAQHFAAEIVGRYRRERRGLPSIALTTDSSVVTAIANDYGYDAVFSRQVEALGLPGDILIGISTSGNSRNVIAALEKARSASMVTVGFTGAGGGAMAPLCDLLFAADSNVTARVQEAHTLAGHMICDWIELDWMNAQTALQTTIQAANERQS